MLTRRSTLAVLLLMLCCGSALAQQAPRPARFALAIGNTAYTGGITPLSNPKNDAAAIARALRVAGFQTELLIDASRQQMAEAVAQLASQAQGAEAVVLYYAGHAVEVGGRNILLPVSATGRGGAQDLERESVPLDEVMGQLRGRATTTMLLLDSCRDNPFGTSRPAPAARSSAPRPQAAAPAGGEATRSVGGGLAGVSSAPGMLIAFATAPGQVAFDGGAGNSPFTDALVRHLLEPDVEVRQMLSRVRRSVREATNGRQIPWDNSSLESDFYVRRVTAATRGPTRYPGPATFTAAASNTIPIPRDVLQRPFRRDSRLAQRWVGTWSSGEARWGGSGRKTMLIVFNVNESAGTAEVLIAGGQPGANSPYQQPPYYVFTHASYRDGMLVFSVNSADRYTYRLAGDNLMEGELEPRQRLGRATQPYRVRLTRVE